MKKINRGNCKQVTNVNYITRSLEKDMFYLAPANRVQYFKQDAKGVATMCRAMEEMRKDERIECALEMLADGMPYEKVAKYSKLSIEEVKELASKKSA